MTSHEKCECEKSKVAVADLLGKLRVVVSNGEGRITKKDMQLMTEVLETFLEKWVCAKNPPVFLLNGDGWTPPISEREYYHESPFDKE